MRATLLNPTGPTDWVDIALGAHVEDDYKALAEVGGVPAIVYVTSPAADVRQINYAYGNMPDPVLVADFTLNSATSLTPVGHYFNPTWLAVQDGLPAFTFWSSQSEQLVLARATTNPPGAPADWATAPLSVAATSGSYCALVDFQDQPLALHGGIGSDHLRCAIAADWQIDSLLDWERHVADTESTGLERVSACLLPNGVAAVYRDPDLGGWLICAWFNGSLPQGAGDWCVMPVAVDIGAIGGQAVAAMRNGQPAIVYGDPDDNELWLATMDLAAW